MPSYDDLKSELESISKVVDRFPETVKYKFFDLLVRTFLGPGARNSQVTPFPHPSPLLQHHQQKAHKRRVRLKGRWRWRYRKQRRSRHIEGGYKT